MPRMQTIVSAVKRLSDITVTELHLMGQRDISNTLKTLPIVMEQVKGEKNRRDGLVVEA